MNEEDIRLREELANIYTQRERELREVNDKYDALVRTTVREHNQRSGQCLNIK